MSSAEDNNLSIIAAPENDEMVEIDGSLLEGVWILFNLA